MFLSLFPMSTAYPLVKCIFASSPFVPKAVGVSPLLILPTKGGEEEEEPSRKNEMRPRTPTFPEKNRWEKKTWLRKMPLLIGDSFSPLCFVAEKGKTEHFEGFSPSPFLRYLFATFHIQQSGKGFSPLPAFPAS